MKKIIAILAVLFSFNQIEGANMIFCTNDNDSSQEIRVIEKNKADSFDETRTRSGGPAVSAYLNADMGQIEIVFNISIGNATIYILDGMGRALRSYNCDTETEWIVYMPAPTAEGNYTLKIDSAVAEYTGDFTL